MLGISWPSENLRSDDLLVESSALSVSLPSGSTPGTTPGVALSLVSLSAGSAHRQTGDNYNDLMEDLTSRIAIGITSRRGRSRHHFVAG